MIQLHLLTLRGCADGTSRMLAVGNACLCTCVMYMYVFLCACTSVCGVCVCVCAYVRACLRACVRVCISDHVVTCVFLPTAKV